MAYLPVRTQKNKNTGLRDLEAQIVNCDNGLSLGEPTCPERFVQVFDGNGKFVVYGLGICVVGFLPKHPPALVTGRNFKDLLLQKNCQPRPEKYVDLNFNHERQ